MMGNTVQKGLWLDPRAKLFLILMCVLCSMFAPSLSYQFALCPADCLYWECFAESGNIP